MSLSIEFVTLNCHYYDSPFLKLHCTLLLMRAVTEMQHTGCYLWISLVVEIVIWEITFRPKIMATRREVHHCTSAQLSSAGVCSRQPCAGPDHLDGCEEVQIVTLSIVATYKLRFVPKACKIYPRTHFKT